ncbi:MAG: tRNA nuclease CdiA-2 [Acinetobacter bereziniae]|uniref:tRNA nuclease CdiA-2 n=1 Tax=Acinetobacter bereziniae TaxID=106648 RepID=A0A833TY52_ACIBZ|nr:MAG: tRNA nuclease CdiA-2 [Acinetobacter bereziniae]
MNKQFYRTKFNAKLGTYVAVSELAKSHQGDTSPRIKASIHNNDVTDSGIAATGQRTLKQLVLALSALMAISPIYANVVVNNGAAAAHKATVLKEGNAANVWITAPSASGVSRNSYTQFDVNQNGVILNNSRGAATSQITKTSIAANPNLAKGAATTIVNEVVSTNPSLLQGNLEVLGSRANVVIANPTGITVNGGGFINANQVTLSTGVLGYNSDDSIKQHTVKQGAITINTDANNRGLGGNANNPVALELLGRSIAINAPVNATTITAVSGANTITADTGAFTATTGTGTVPNRRSTDRWTLCK